MELEIENYTAESGFDDFYNRNMPRIRKNLKGRKMKKRHLKNAKALLDESTGLPEKVKEEIILDGIEETVRESDQESYDGEEFDHFKFANKIKKKAVAVKNRRINAVKKRIFNGKAKRAVPSSAIENGQLGSPVNAVENIAPAKSSPVTRQTSPLPSPSPSPAMASSGVESREESQQEVSQENGAQELTQAKISTPIVSKGKNLLAGLVASKPPVANVPTVPVKSNKLKMIAIAAGVLIVAAIVIVYIRSKKA